jgi:hypothetical protein
MRPRNWRHSVRFHTTNRVLLVVAATTLIGASPLLGQDPDRAAQSDEAAALAKQVQNPLANLVTLPVQMNHNNNVGEFERRVTNWNVQPVIPFPAGEYNIIARTIIPFVSLPVDSLGSIAGVGDWALSLFVSPAQPGAVIWGVGPAFILPTASNPDVLGTGKLSIGPTGVLFWGPGKWTLGAVANNVWSVGGQSNRESVNQFFAQWFVNYNFGGGWALGTAPIITCDWNAPSGEQCTIPLGLQGSKVLRFGSMPVNLLIGYYKNVEHPTGGADEQIRLQINMMFPQKQQ